MERCLPGYAARAKDALTRELRENIKNLFRPIVAQEILNHSEM